MKLAIAFTVLVGLNLAFVAVLYVRVKVNERRSEMLRHLKTSKRFGGYLDE